MQHAILKLIFLIFTMSVVCSSTENAGTCQVNQTVSEAPSCKNDGSLFAINTNCKKQAVAKDKSHEAPAVPEPDNELPLSPISRFILLQ